MKSDIPGRAFELAQRVVKLCLVLDEKPGVSRTLANQLLRSGTSIGANVEEAQAAQSDADFISKYSIACKEARETHYWLRLLSATETIRMLVVLYFHHLGYSPFEVAMLFLFYEVFGIVTNLVGGWLGARIGLNLTMHIGMGMQVVALLMLTVPDPWLSVAYIMLAQALSGIAKDLNKMSAKATVKTLTGEGSESKLFKYVAVLTGSKNALKGLGFFVGAALLEGAGGGAVAGAAGHGAAAAERCRQAVDPSGRLGAWPSCWERSRRFAPARRCPFSSVSWRPASRSG